MLQIGAVLFYYKLRQTLLQIGAASILQIEASAATNWGQLLHIGAKFNVNWGSFTN